MTLHLNPKDFTGEYTTDCENALSPATHICEKHGEIDQTFRSTMRGHECTLCLRCLVELLQRHLKEVKPVLGSHPKNNL